MEEKKVAVLTLRATINNNSISSLSNLMIIVIDDRLTFPEEQYLHLTFVNHSLNNKHTIYLFTCHPRPLRTCPSRFL